MICIDVNETHKLALVINRDPDNRSSRYELLTDEHVLVEEWQFSPYLPQHHYVAGHRPQGLMIASLNTPRDGWRFWRPDKLRRSRGRP